MMVVKEGSSLDDAVLGTIINESRSRFGIIPDKYGSKKIEIDRLKLLDLRRQDC